jgi:hypothetical protein
MGHDRRSGCGRLARRLWVVFSRWLSVGRQQFHAETGRSMRDDLTRHAGITTFISVMPWMRLE